MKALRVAHEKGKLVSFDVNYRNVMWKDDLAACTAAVMDILKYVDMLKISEEEVEMMGGEAALPELMKRTTSRFWWRLWGQWSPGFSKIR